MDALFHIKNKFKLDFNAPSPIHIAINKHRDLPVLFNELGYKTGAEIGVRRGIFSRALCAAIPNLKLYLIDPYVEYQDTQEYKNQEYQDNCLAKAREKLKGFNCEFIKKPSASALKKFDNNSLDFVYIDGNHSIEFVINDIAGWIKKVRPGGIISGHDYDMSDVGEAVRAWVKLRRINPWFITDDTNWFWVKQ